jgi:hypothetical protein
MISETNSMINHSILHQKDKPLERRMTPDEIAHGKTEFYLMNPQSLFKRDGSNGMTKTAHGSPYKIKNQ